MSSKEDCGETLKAEIRALRKKYGGFAVDFMNKVCQIEDGDSGDPEPNDGGFRDPDGPESWFRRWNLNWPNIDSLAGVYTDAYDGELGYVHCCFVEGNSFNDKYQPDPTIFLWTINAIMAESRKSGKIHRPFIISSSTAPSWAKILTTNLSERNLSKVRVNMDHSSDLTSLKIWAHESKVMFRVELFHFIEEHIYDPFLSNLFLQNRVTKLNIFDPYKFDSDVIPRHLLPSLEFLKALKHPALEIIKIMMFDDDDEIDTEHDINGILQSMTGLRSIRRLDLTMYSHRKSLDYFVDHFLTHTDCKVHDVYVKWIAEDLTIDTALNVDRYDQYAATPLEVEYLLKILHNCPSIRSLNYYNPKIWKYESNVRQTMVKFFVVLQQNQVGRGFVLDPSCYRTPSSHGIFSHLLDRAYNRMDTKKPEFGDFDYDYIQYEEGVDHHHQDHPYDGIYYMIKELAGRGVLGKADDISEDDKSFITRPSKICKR